MKNSIIIFLFQYRSFWRLRTLVYKFLFWIGSFVFQFQFRTRENKDNYFGLRHLFQITQVQLILALLFATFLQLVDPIVYDFYKLAFLKIPEDSDYVTFLVTISGIGGVFIGLYYTAISSIGGSIYAKVPNNIRDLLAQERIGNVYMHFLSFITFLGVSLVAFRILGFERVYLAIPVMLIVAGVGIIAFVKLGQRAFYLFDPTALSLHLFGQLRHFTKMVSAGGYRWDDASFQNHAYKLASSSLDTLETLSDITKNEVHLRGAPFIALSKNLLTFLLFYENTKKHIPSESQWYEQKYVHRDWYRTEDTRISIAHQTGTSIGPDITNNKEWIEARVLPIIRECLEINLREERYNEVLGLSEYINEYLDLLARNGNTTQALNILEELGDGVTNIVSPGTENDIVADEIIEKLAVIERFSSMPITIALACCEYIENIDSVKVEKQLSKINWDNDSDLYIHEFPAYCLPKLEWFKPRLKFEELTEDQKVTPIWYQKELLLQIVTDTFVENINSLCIKAKYIYSSWIKITTDCKHPWLVGAVMSREWEFWHKVNSHIDLWPPKWSNLSDSRKIEGLPWSNLEYDELKKDSNTRQLELLKLMSKHQLMLAFFDRPDGFPDYAGQFLHTTGEVAFEALLTNNIDLLGNVFSMYLYGCILRFDKLLPKSSTMDWQTQQDYKIAAAPLLDLMELSGYARLMADYHNNEQLWVEVVNAWDKYIADKGDQSPLPVMAGAIALTDGAFEIPHRGVLRTNWATNINRHLSEVPRHEVYSRHSILSHTEIDHVSPLIRVFAKRPYGGFHEGIDIFITYYLKNKNGENNLDFGWKKRDLQQSLDRETKRGQVVNEEELE